MATYLTTTGKQFLAIGLDCGGAGNVSCNPYWINFTTCGAAGAAPGDTGLGIGIQAKSSATCEYTSAVDTWAIIGTMTLACAAADIIRAGAFWMSYSNATMSCGLFISGDHTTIAGLITNDQVQYTITLQFT